jgi:hypothetical protein
LKGARGVDYTYSKRKNASEAYYDLSILAKKRLKKD